MSSDWGGFGFRFDAGSRDRIYDGGVLVVQDGSP
jgi:hypothetical protein